MNYNNIATYFKPFVPFGLRKLIREKHQSHIFSKALKKFSLLKNGDVENNRALLADLIYGWGNLGWSALDDYLYEVLLQAQKVDGNILECGSGLSTLLVGILTRGKGIKFTALEHQKEWANKTQKLLKHYNCEHVEIKICPIVSYESYDWYKIDELPNNLIYDLVICDGPPSNTKGGRVGLLPVMKKKLSNKAIILMDDVIRQAERQVIDDWSKSYKLESTTKGTSDKYAIVKLIENN